MNTTKKIETNTNTLYPNIHTNTQNNFANYKVNNNNGTNSNNNRNNKQINNTDLFAPVQKLLGTVTGKYAIYSNKCAQIRFKM